MQSRRDLLLTADALLDDVSDEQRSTLLADASGVTKEMLRGSADERPDAHVVIQNVSAIMAKALADGNAAIFSQGINALADIWTVGDTHAMYPTRTPDFEASLWEIIAAELYALGGLAIRSER